MKRFSDFATENILDGDKIRIDDVFNEEIKVINYSIKESKYGKNSSGKYLMLQIVKNERNYVIFTGSDVLIDQIEKYSHEMPFLATIRKINRYYSLT
jgi:hypothetical protein